jgi:UDP-N-acetylglucosamine/UDP-N-acetylgalactosamine 4-epimerase
MGGATPIYAAVQAELRQRPRTWLVTGVAGFIGSHLLEMLLGLDQTVIGLDNFATGSTRNLEDVAAIVGSQQWDRFHLLEGDIRDLAMCRQAVTSASIVLHQAALGSVPRSVENPITSHEVNVSGFLNMLVAARDAEVASFVYASSSSVYGDEERLPQLEQRIGQPLSPYALTKRANEFYAQVFDRTFGFKSIGLRYFNVFGRRQDPNGPYAAVIPRWIAAMARDEDVIIYGDGETTRDFCFVANAVQANLLAAVNGDQARGEIFNVSFGARTSLNELFASLRLALREAGIHYNRSPIYTEFRRGDIRHSQADIDKARRLIGYRPEFALSEGVHATLRPFTEEKRPAADANQRREPAP